MKPLLPRLLLLLAALSYSIAGAGAERIAIFDYDQRTAENPGIAPYLEQQLRASIADLTLDRFTANSDRQQGIELLDRLDSENWDLIVTITTDALHLALHRLRNTPFVFTNVNNPKAFGIDTGRDQQRRFTGASYYVPARQQLEFFLSIQPDIDRLGFLFDPDNRSMQVEAQEVRQACLELGIELRYRRVSADTSLAAMAAELATDGVDAIVATSSDKIYLRIGQIEQGIKQQQAMANTAASAGGKIPIYSFNVRGVEQGALAALASDHRQMVDQLVIPRVQALLSGNKSAAELTIGYLAMPQRYFNDRAMATFGFERPQP